MCEVAYHYSLYTCDFCASNFQVYSMPFLDFLTRRFILRLMRVIDVRTPYMGIITPYICNFSCS